MLIFFFFFFLYHQSQVATYTCTLGNWVSVFLQRRLCEQLLGRFLEKAELAFDSTRYVTLSLYCQITNNNPCSRYILVTQVSLSEVLVEGQWFHIIPLDSVKFISKCHV